MRQWINKQYLTPQRIKQVQQQYQQAQPTRHIALINFFNNKKFKELEVALRKETFTKKEADLFSFYQTNNLHTSTNRTIKDFTNFIKSTAFTTLINTITNITTTPGNIDAAGFNYKDTDHLLCHDDQLSTRKIAYVINFSTLNQQEGGALIFFNSNKQQSPTTIATKIKPQHNTLVLFTVTPTSHHMVQEVQNAERLSIAGWFHA